MSRFVTTARHQRANEYQDPDPFGVLFVWRWKTKPRRFVVARASHPFKHLNMAECENKIAG